MTQDVLDVVVCWHMHQPWYVVDDSFVRPWVYLHALKDYADMAAHLETDVRARAVVNFVPVLLEQIERYAQSVQSHVAGGSTPPDPLLAALAANEHPEAGPARSAIVAACLAAKQERATHRFPAYRRVLEFAASVSAGPSTPEAGRYLSDQFLDDLILWTHLVWIGEHDHRNDPRIRDLVARGSAVGNGFDKTDRQRLYAVVVERLTGLLPRYRRLVDTGKVELAMSPWAHPLVPLLLDFGAAHETLPGSPLPQPPHYPGGMLRARWHLAEAIATMERIFGRRPRGCWPPEAAISHPTLELLGEAGFEWAASSGAVLGNSLNAGDQHIDCRHRPFQHGGIRVFFRDDGLSDLIGFSYKDWPPHDAVNDLVNHMLRIAQHCQRSDAVVTIALDGENAWEHYPGNAFDFLAALYERLGSTPGVRLTTFGEHLDRKGETLPLDRVVAGSWVYGTLATWIGHPEKNRAWELLIAAKQRFDALSAPSRSVERALAVCEGSDWYWWLGDDNSTASVSSFDELFRAHMRAFYRALGETPPAVLETPLSRGSAGAVAHLMRPTNPLPGEPA